MLISMRVTSLQAQQSTARLANTAREMEQIDRGTQTEGKRDRQTGTEMERYREAEREKDSEGGG